MQPLAEAPLAFVPSTRPVDSTLDTANHVDGHIGNAKLYQSADDVLFDASTAILAGDFAARQTIKRRDMISEPWQRKDGVSTEGSDQKAQANVALTGLADEASQKGLTPLDLARESLNEAYGELNVLLNLLPLIKGHTVASTMTATASASQHQPQAQSIALFDRTTIIGNPPPASWFTRQGERMLGFKEMQLESASGLLNSAAARLKSFSRCDYAESLIALKSLCSEPSLSSSSSSLSSSAAVSSRAAISDWLVGLPLALLETAVELSLLLTAMTISGRLGGEGGEAVTRFKDLRSLQLQASNTSLLQNAAIAAAKEKLLSSVLTSTGPYLTASLTPHLLCIPPSCDPAAVAFLLEEQSRSIVQLLAPCVMADGLPSAAGTGGVAPPNQVAITSEGLQAMLASAAASEVRQDEGEAVSALTLLYPSGFSGARKKLVVVDRSVDGALPSVVDLAEAMATLAGFAAAPSSSFSGVASLASLTSPLSAAGPSLSLATALAKSIIHHPRGSVQRSLPITRVEAQVFELLSYSFAECAWREFSSSSSGDADAAAPGAAGAAAASSLGFSRGKKWGSALTDWMREHQGAAIWLESS